MAAQPPALLIQCPHCGWRRIWQPASDALTDIDLLPARCPKCQHAQLQARPCSAVTAALWAWIRSWRASS